MPLALLTSSRLALIQDMLLTDVYIYVFIFNIYLTDILCSPFTCKKNRFCLILTKMNTQFVINIVIRMEDGNTSRTGRLSCVC